MTPKQRRFVTEYLVDGNATQAAVRAGYSADTAKQQGSRLLTNVDVSAAVAQATAGLQKSTIADAHERREILTLMLRSDLMKSESRIKAADVLNKMDGLYVQKHEVTNLTKPDLSKLSDAELAQLQVMMAKAQPVQREAVH